jgi:hypothetical protein
MSDDTITAIVDNAEDPAKTGPKPKQLISVEVQGYEIGRGMNRRMVFDTDVYKLAAMGCTDSEIATWFDVKLDTLRYNFANVIAKGREDLKQSLRMSQIKLALSGNATMLIWLGKNILGQQENPLAAENTTVLPWSDN